MTNDNELMEQVAGAAAGDEAAEGEQQLSPYDDKDAINKRIDKRLEIDRFQRSIFERGWFRNILFYVGQQWIIFEKGRWRPRELPAWFPRAQSNKFAEKTNDIISALVQGRVPISYMPATDDPADAATAEVGARVREVMYAEAKVDDKEMEIAAWMLLTGNSFLVPYYDMDKKNGTSFVQHEQCNACDQVMSPADVLSNGGSCATCQELGAQTSDFRPAVDESTGEKIGDEFPIGALTVDVCSPFEIRLDHRIRSLDDHRYFVRVRRYDEDFAKEHWTNYADDITSDSSGSSNDSSLSQHYLDILSQVTDAFNPASGGISTSAKGGSHKKKVTAYEFYELPSAEYPEGIRAVRIGTSANTIVEAGPLPTQYGAGIRKGQKFLPLVHFGFDLVPGRYWKKTRMDDLIPLQIFRNTVEANLRLSAQRMGNAIWLEPKGSGIDVITGEPGQKVKYNPVSMGGSSFAKPERIPAELSNLQPLIMLMNKIDDAMERIAGTFFLQGGDCVTEDTQCLTRRGWTGQENLNVDDDIYSIDPENGRGFWAKVNRIYRNPSYKGPIYNIKSQGISGLFTPGHDWLVGNVDDYQYKKNGRGRKQKREKGLHKLATEELKTHHFIPVADSLISKGSSDSSAFIKFAGWLFTDGYYFYRRDARGSTLRSIAITQSEIANTEKCSIIRQVLVDLGLSATERKKADGMIEFHISGQFAEDFVARFPNKRATQEFLAEMSGEQAQLFIDAMLLGDGYQVTHDTKRKHKSIRFTSTDEKLADAFQFAATLAGHSTYRSSKKRKTVTGKIEYTVSIKSTRRISLLRVLPKMKTKEFEGLIWCPTTSTGNWIARNNGRVFATGNTPPGVTAASALAYLGERAQKSMSPLMREWAKGWKRFEEFGLEIARENWDDARVRMVAGKNKRWETQKFMSADLQGAVNLEIDYNSLFPKSHAATRATIQQLIEMQVISPADPEQNWKILSEFGETKLKGSIDIDVKEAVKEADDFFTNDTPPELIPIAQNSVVHLLQHTDFAKTDEFKALKKEQKDVWYAHIQATVADIVARKAAFASMGVDPNAPGLGEVSSGEANIAAQASAATMPVVDPAEHAINAAPDGQPVPKEPAGRNKPQPPMTPDIAAGNTPRIKGMQQPRVLNKGQ